MKYYFVSNASEQYLFVTRKHKCSILLSYFLIRNKKQIVPILSTYPADILLDCGAFSAWSLNSKIQLDEYVKFVVENSHLFEKILSLDEIQKDNTSQAKIESGKKSYENYLVMRKFVPYPKLVPVFHFEEDFSLLEQYIKDGNDVIGLGGLAGSFKPGSKGKLDVKRSMCWFAKIFTTFSKQKFHGLGMFSKTLLLTFPFYSVDSTHWLQTGRYGHILGFDDSKMKLWQLSFRDKKTWDKLTELKSKGTTSFRSLADFPGSKNYLNRSSMSIVEIRKYVDFVTKLWEVRGIKW